MCSIAVYLWPEPKVHRGRGFLLAHLILTDHVINPSSPDITIKIQILLTGLRTFLYQYILFLYPLG